MNYNSDINSLTKKLEKINSVKVEKDIKLADYSSFKVGGTADLFVTPQNVEAVKRVMPRIYKSKIPYFILGKGSNLIISDQGYRGIILYTGELDNYQIQNKTITAETGIELSELAKIAYQNSLSGFEFADG